jgi:hypothetical protein
MNATGDSPEDSAGRPASREHERPEHRPVIRHRQRRHLELPVPYPAGNNPEVRGVKNFLMISGIIGGFSMYIVPGFFGIRTYRRWKRGEIPPPTRWMIWGAISLVLLPFALLYGMANSYETSFVLVWQWSATLGSGAVAASEGPPSGGCARTS